MRASITALRKKRRIRIVLIPIAVLYGLVTDLRNFLFDSGIIRPVQFNVPLISVGNISAGGTGKTPFTMLLFELLSPYFNKPVIISRGYGRKSRGVRIVSDGEGHFLSVQEAGDEPLMMARKFPQTVVIVAEKRRAGIVEALRRFSADLILLDDAFQHRAVKRDCDIVLINAANNPAEEPLLPLGNLRERIKHLRRAGMIVLTYTEADGLPAGLPAAIPFAGEVFQCIFSAGLLVNAQLVPSGAVAMLQGKRCLAFAAIADPERFRQMLGKLGILLVAFYAYPDHHYYTEREMHFLRSEALEKKADFLLTTEKDLLKLDSAVFKDINLAGISQKSELKNPAKFLNNLRQFIDFKSQND
jgi:tetraacyldisaccharide 4'-kinase